MSLLSCLLLAVFAVIVFLDWCCLKVARRSDNTEEVR